MKRDITLELGDFACASLEEEADRSSVPLATLIEDAAGHYLAGPEERPARRLPRFLEEPSGRCCARIDLDLSETAWLALEERARAEGAPLERVLEHAAMLYLADRGRGP